MSALEERSTFNIPTSSFIYQQCSIGQSDTIPQTSRAIPWVLERMRVYPANLSSLYSFFSSETFTNASSPKTLRYIVKTK